jgi:hypothetical protein
MISHLHCDYEIKTQVWIQIFFDSNQDFTVNSEIYNKLFNLKICNNF